MQVQRKTLRHIHRVESIAKRYSSSVTPSPKVPTLLSSLQAGEPRGNEFGLADYVGATTESTFENSVSFEDLPVTQSEDREDEPLDNTVEDCYRLHEPITDSPETVDKSRYLNQGEAMTACEAVKSYKEARHGENVSATKNGFKRTRNWRAKAQYARGKEMDRKLLQTYEDPTTVLLSLRVAPGGKGRLTLLNELHEATNPTLEQLRYRLCQATDAPLTADEWEYFAVIAGTEKRATPHLHVFVYCDGDVPRDQFVPVVEKFVEKCSYAPNDMRGNAPESGAISIRGNGDDRVPRRSEVPAESRGATYVLTQLPHLRPVDKMAQDELLHSSTVDAWCGNAFRKSSYSVWDDNEPSVEKISDNEPT